MPPEASKLLERMKRSKSGWKRTDLDQLYTGFGFIIVPGGKHDKVYHPIYPQLITSLPRHTTVAPYLVRQAISLVERLRALVDEGKSNE